MSDITVTISWGEAIDKLTVLSNKINRINDPEKQADARKEKTLLENAVLPLVSETQLEAFEKYKETLLAINEQLWDLQDKQDIHVANQNLGEEFATVSLSINAMNRERFKVKSEINRYFNSSIREVKSYTV